jgi:lipid-A-disaccharide synthase
MRIGIVAGELSGDLLGAGLIRAVKARHPDALFEGIAGQNMIAAGCISRYPLETLSVMGLVEVIKHYRIIKRCRDELRDYFLAHPPDIFIGIDAPDFNFGLEYALKSAGISTVHYVSPSVWAWREYRLRKIAKSCDLMLTLLPFEEEYYHRYHIPVQFVGHPLADEIAFDNNKNVAREKLGLSINNQWLAILVGSRHTEVSKLAVPFLQTAQALSHQYPNLRFVLPLANQSLKTLFRQYLIESKIHIPLTLLDGQSQLAMAAADVVLMASGTATLEAMLLKRPMVVAYRLAPMTYWLAKFLVSVPYFSLPNLLAQENLVPEFLQHDAVPEKLSTAVAYWLDNPEKVAILQSRFAMLHIQLRQSASEKAAQAILSLYEQKHIDVTHLST